MTGIMGSQAQNVASEAFEVKGTIKWFDVVKGYGFIIPSDGTADILLHMTCLREAGHTVALEGATVICEAIKSPKGLQAKKLLEIDNSTAVADINSSDFAAAAHVVASGDFERAVVKWFNRARGFGFLTRGPDTEDIFVHMETLRRLGLRELQQGQRVQVRYGAGPKGLLAAEIRPDEDH